MSAAAPDVLFVILDSMRTDRVSTYGHDRETTPTLDRLAERATVFENAYTPAPWTLPSHCSMFTGRFPSEHGVTNGFTEAGFGLSAETETLTETLADRGYRTAGFSNNPWVGQLSGLDRGFEEFVEWDLELSRESGAPIHGTRDDLYSRGHTLLGHAARQPLVLLKRRFFTSNLVDRATRWLSHTADDDAPTFTFLNLMEAHSPYYPPRAAFEALDLDPPSPIEARRINTELLAYVMGKTDLSEARRRRVMEFYDASLRYQDAKFRELLAHLLDQDRFEETLLVVCADHGKTLGEYDRDGTPPHYLRNINVNVPLFVKEPGQTTGERIAAPFELVGLHDVLRNREPGRDHVTGPALVEDHIPHTGTDPEAVTRWRGLADGSRIYLRNETDEEFLIEPDDAVTTDPAAMGPFRSTLEDRVATLDVAATDAAASDTEVTSSTERQLHDLGYL